MVYRQQKLACLLSVILGASLNTYAQEVKILGLFGDRAFIKVDTKSSVLKIGQKFQDVELVSVTPQQATLKIEGKEIVLVAGQTYVSEPVIINEAPKEPVNKVDIYVNLNQQYIVNGMINNRIVTFLVDTGANTISMTRKEAQRLGIDFRLKGKEGLSGTANGVVKNWIVMLDKVKVGTISLSYVEASIRDTEDNMPILLGMSFLKRVKLEQANQRMTLTAK